MSYYDTPYGREIYKGCLKTLGLGNCEYPWKTTLTEILECKMRMIQDVCCIDLMVLHRQQGIILGLSLYADCVSFIVELAGSICR